MSRVCSICGKGASAGNNRSHALNITKRIYRPNIHKTTVEIDGKTLVECVNLVKEALGK